MLKSETSDSTGVQVAALVESLTSKSPDAGGLLNSLFRDKLVRFCAGYLGRIEEAEDAAQDICFKALSMEKVPAAFRTWLYRTARNHCLNLLRGRDRQREATAMPAGSQIHEELTGHLTRLVRNEQQSQLVELVARLPESYREVLRLRYVEDLSRAEIADILDTPESIVKSRLFEGLRRLRDSASEADDSTPAG